VGYILGFAMHFYVYYIFLFLSFDVILFFSVLAKSLTHYKDMNGVEKCQKLGGLGG